MENNPYELSDITADLLRKQAIRRFQNARVKANVIDFDELDVIRICTELYENLDNDNKKKFLELAKKSYNKSIPNKKKKEEPDLFWLLALLNEYDPITKYIYNHEVERKKAYLQEAIISVADAKKGFKDLVGITRANMLKTGRLKSRTTKTKRSSIKKEFDKALRYWARMTDQYCIDVSDSAQMKAFVDAGIVKVKWVTEKDNRVCLVCKERDGKVYKIDEVPQKPHYFCRCYLIYVE